VIDGHDLVGIMALSDMALADVAKAVPDRASGDVMEAVSS
jgi:hypothetical protein